MTLQAQPTFTAAAPPDKKMLGGAALPTTNPVNIFSAHGIVPDDSLVTLAPSAACVLTLFVWNPPSLNWINPGSVTAKYTLTFTGAGFSDYFQVKPGTRFYIKSDTPDITCDTNALEIK